MGKPVCKTAVSLLRRSQYSQDQFKWLKLLLRYAEQEHFTEILFVAEVSSCYKASSDSDLPDMTSIGEVVIARAHVTVLARPRDAETRRVAGGWSVVQLSLQVVTTVTSSVEVKGQVS